MLAAQLFHQGTSLLELAQGGRMEPDILGVGVYLLAQHPDGVALASPHLAYLLAEKARDDDTQLV